MALLLFVSLFPFFWMLRTALSTNADLVTGSQSLLPDNPTLLNVRQALGLASTEELTKAGTLTSADVNFFTALRNSRDRLHADHARAGHVLLDGGLRVRAPEVPGPRQAVLPVPDGDDDPADLHADPELRADQEPRLAEHLPGHRGAVLPDDAVRGVLPAPVLPRHLQGGRGGRAARRRGPLEDLPPADPADGGRAAGDARGADLHHRLARVHVAAGRPATARTSACSPSR